jgi:hypothetical protein
LCCSTSAWSNTHGEANALLPHRDQLPIFGSPRPFHVDLRRWVIAPDASTATHPYGASEVRSAHAPPTQGDTMHTNQSLESASRRAGRALPDALAQELDGGGEIASPRKNSG